MYLQENPLVKPKIEKLNDRDEVIYNRTIEQIHKEERMFEKQHMAKLNLIFKRCQPEITEEIDLARKLSNTNLDNSPLTENQPIEKIEQNIKELLISNGEVDIEKVLCLHMLAIKQSDICGQIMEEEVRRPINVFTRYANLLPNYIIEEDETKTKCLCWPRRSKKMNCDSRPIKIHLMINKQIEQIINIVISTLKDLNEKKLKLMINMAHNINVLKSILVRPSNQTFLKELLKSKLITSNDFETEVCTLIRGKNELIRDINKYKKNMVFRLNPPNSFSYLLSVTQDREKANEIEEQQKESYFSLLDICNKISAGEKLNLSATGISILRNHSLSSGMAVINEDGTDITYVSSPRFTKTKSMSMFVNNLTLLLKTSGLSGNQQVVVPQKKEMLEEKESSPYIRLMTRRIRALERMARKHVNLSPSFEPKQPKERKTSTDSEAIKSRILQRLSNQQRISLAQEAAKIKKKPFKDKDDSDSSHLAVLMNNVLSKRSLLNIARDSSMEEREYFLKPVTKGGMGVGELIIGKNNMAKMEKLAALGQSETTVTLIDPVEQNVAAKANAIDLPMESSWDLLKIKHDISRCEIKKKFNKFIKTNNTIKSRAERLKKIN